MVRVDAIFSYSIRKEVDIHSHWCYYDGAGNPAEPLC